MAPRHRSAGQYAERDVQFRRGCSHADVCCAIRHVRGDRHTDHSGGNVRRLPGTAWGSRSDRTTGRSGSDGAAGASRPSGAARPARCPGSSGRTWTARRSRTTRTAGRSRTCRTCGCDRSTGSSRHSGRAGGSGSTRTAGAARSSRSRRYLRSPSGDDDHVAAGNTSACRLDLCRVISADARARSWAGDACDAGHVPKAVAPRVI